VQTAQSSSGPVYAYRNRNFSTHTFIIYTISVKSGAIVRPYFPPDDKILSMKFLPSQLYYFMRNRPSRMNIFNLLRFLAVLAGLVTFYSIAFHYIMAWEGRAYSWVTGFYWTLTVMSTLGFGDITFESDLGRIFSILVLLSGIVFLLVLLPFTFIEFFYAPWMKAQSESRAPSSLPPTTRNHVILTALEPVSSALIEKLEQYQYRYVLLVHNLEDALRLYDLGYTVVVGNLDNPDTYRKIRAEHASMVVTTANDMVNTNVAYTVREISETVPIVATANSPASVDILELAGSNHVLQLGVMTGQALARRVSGGDRRAHIIGQFEELFVAEATVRNTPLVGKKLRESGLREELGITVLGVWERGTFGHAHANLEIQAGTVLVLAGPGESIQRYNDRYAYRTPARPPVIIIGGGRVGRAVAASLRNRGLNYYIVEKTPERIYNPDYYVLGNAAELKILEKAGIMETGTVVVTTHDDDTNIYLTIYCRRLRPDVQIISRATLERNIATLHRAGADFVMSYASMGANTIMNLLDNSNVLTVAEGLDVIRLPIPPALGGKTLAETRLRQETGCTVVAIQRNGDTNYSPDPKMPLPRTGELILIGTNAAEQKFLRLYPNKTNG
jgi:voltage-gated potassium channel